MEVKFIKASPTENMTLLIETPVAREKQLAVAERLIAYGSVYAEQAGYIEEAENPAAEKRLQMMAGEFCGNASLSLAAWLAKKKNLPIGEKTEITLEVSGAEELVRCEIERETEHRFLGRVAMPLPQCIETRAFTLDGERIELTAVVFAGITHILVPVSLWGENAAKKAERAARVWAKELPPVFGLLLFDEPETSGCGGGCQSHLGKRLRQRNLCCRGISGGKGEKGYYRFPQAARRRDARNGFLSEWSGYEN